jgi:hypothetical protein
MGGEIIKAEGEVEAAGDSAFEGEDGMFDLWVEVFSGQWRDQVALSERNMAQSDCP